MAVATVTETMFDVAVTVVPSFLAVAIQKSYVVPTVLVDGG